MQGEPNEHRIFVGGISDDIDDEELSRAFSEHGPVFNVSVMSHRGYGFVSYHRKQHAENAIEDMNGKYLGYRAMRVDWAFGWPKDDISSDDDDEEEDESEGNEYDTVFSQTSYSNCTVYCGGFADGISRESIEHIFSPFGEIEEISVFDDRNYAFIRFSTKEAATLAICSINDTYIGGDLVRCNWSHRPNYHIQQEIYNIFGQSSSSESSPESSRSSSPTFDNFENVLNQTSPNNCTVYCGGLEGHITEGQLQSIFSPYGEIEEISLYTEWSDYAFIRFTTKVSAALAICAVNNAEINGETVRCNWSRRPDYRNPATEAAASSSTSDAPSSIPEPGTLPSPPEAAASSSSASHEPNGAAKGKNPDLLCKICMDEELGMVFLPCGHLTSCSKCAKKINLCPMCRKKITGRVRTFLS